MASDREDQHSFVTLGRKEQLMMGFQNVRHIARAGILRGSGKDEAIPEPGVQQRQHTCNVGREHYHTDIF